MNHHKLHLLKALSILPFLLQSLNAALPSGIVMKDIWGDTFTMGSASLIGSPNQQIAAPEHPVTLSPYSMSEAEITNAQYVEFLNAALADGLIQVVTGTRGPDNGKQIIQGTSLSSYEGKVLYSLDGTRVMKDHDNTDNDDNPFTGEIEPENPLNISYIGYNTTTENFYVKDPMNITDFHWYDICNYQDYGSVQGTFEPTIKNDFADWSGSGQNLSDELQNWTEGNPEAATNLPSQSEVSEWPVTFIRWWGAQAFADYYNVSLPTEAQWEYAAKGGQDFTYAVHDGSDLDDANWNQAALTTATGHVRAAVSGTANPFGFYNLAGNAWEWIADNYVAPYDTVAVNDPLVQDPSSTLRSWRGGSWNYHQATLQSAMRFYDEEDRGNDHFGFRIAGENSIVQNYNTWTDSHFTASDPNRDASDDPDGDSLPNLLEFIFNTDPQLATSSPNLPTVQFDSEGNYILEYIRTVQTTDAPLTYLTSADLETWETAIEDTNYTQSVSDNNDGTETITINFPKSERLFIRVLAEML
ncbi:MAG: formylglycine-generating enzyme family protein [Opitutaceae bacterium]